MINKIEINEPKVYCMIYTYLLSFSTTIIINITTIIIIIIIIIIIFNYRYY